MNLTPLRKNRLLFRFFVFFALIALLNTFVAEAQSYKTDNISIKVEKQPIQSVFAELTKKTGFKFFYSDAVSDGNYAITLNKKNVLLDEILQSITEQTGLLFSKVDNTYYVNKKKAPDKKTSNKKVIQGKVLDDEGMNLPGVSVVIVGSTKGVITDTDGTFSIDADDSDKLAFSFIGMIQRVVDVAKVPDVVIMKPLVNELDEVTVVAFGKQKKESVISSISTVKPGNLKIASSNLTTALAGNVSGLIAYQRSGEPGQDDANFFVRGVTSFTYASGPMILIDGVEMTSSDLARLQPDDIASFSILKDAAATAVYGARGANGIIMVTTRGGKEGKAVLSIRYETSISRPTRNIELADPISYMRLNNEAVLSRNPLASPPYSVEKIESTLAGRNGMVYPANDWYDIMFKPTAQNHRLNFNLSGGGKTARYYIAGTFNVDNGNLRTDKNSKFNNIDLKTYQLRSKVDINVTPTTQATVILHGNFEDYTGPLDGGTEVYSQVLRADPVLFPAYYKPDLAHAYTKHTLFGNNDRGQYINPYANMVKGYKDYSKSKMMAQFEIKQDLDFILKGLSARVLFSTDRYSFFDVRRSLNPFYYTVGGYDKIKDEYTLIALNDGTGTNPGSETLGYNVTHDNTLINSSMFFEGAIDYANTFKEVHDLSGVLVLRTNNNVNGYANSLLLSLPKRNIGLSGRFTYAYDRRYFVEASFGYNGSERFAKKNRFGFFPAVVAGWLVSNEEFYKGFALSNVLSKLKLKASYGLSGNDAIGNANDRFFYLYDVNINDPARGFAWGDEGGYRVNGVSMKRYADELITWEISKKMNLGLEFSLFNKVEVQADYYTEDRSNILMNRSVPASMGLQSLSTPLQANVGRAFSKGVDLSADINHSFNNDFWITGRVNFTYSVPKYKRYEEPDNSDTPWLSHINQNVGQQWGYVAERLFVDDNEVNNSPVQTFGAYGAGDIKYRDINGDDVINKLDMVPIGYPTTPQIIYGFGLSLGYKTVDFSFFFQGLGRESFWIDAFKTSPFIDTDGNGGITSKNALLKAYADNHWSEDNRNVNALWPRFNTTSISGDTKSNNTQTSTWFMRDGSFLRLKSIELGYKLPESWLRKIYISSCRFYVSGVNLLTFSKFKLWDPEMAGNGFGYPIQKVINVGAQISF